MAAGLAETCWKSLSPDFRFGQIFGIGIIGFSITLLGYIALYITSKIIKK